MFLLFLESRFSSACSSFYGIHLPFCILAGGLEASQIYSTEKEYEYMEAPSDNKHDDDEPGIPALSDLQVRRFSDKTFFLWRSVETALFYCV